MLPGYTFFTPYFTYLFTYPYIHLHMSGVLLHCYCLSFVSIDLLAKNRIFLGFFSITSILMYKRGDTAYHHIFSISNFTSGPI